MWDWHLAAATCVHFTSVSFGRFAGEYTPHSYLINKSFDDPVHLIV